MRPTGARVYLLNVGGPQALLVGVLCTPTATRIVSETFIAIYLSPIAMRRHMGLHDISCAYYIHGTFQGHVVQGL